MEGTCTFLSCPPGVKRLIHILWMFNAQIQEDKMPSKKLRLTVYLSPEEHTAIAASASRAGLSLSTFAKRVCTGMPVPSLEHKQAVLDILKTRADLGRLGGLLKQALGEGKGPEHELRRLLREIEARQAELKAAAGNIR